MYMKHALQFISSKYDAKLVSTRHNKMSVCLNKSKRKSSFVCNALKSLTFITAEIFKYS